jgi:hypothetical protein
MRRTWGTVLLALLASLALLGACSDDSGDGDAATEATDAAPTSTPDATAGDPPSSDTAPTSEPEGGSEADVPDAYVGYTSEQYADGRNWLCHPADADENVCERDLDATLVAPDGTTTPEVHERAEDPAIDCFYVYPTISADSGLNADLEPGDNEEIRALVNQAARLDSVCEVYAPVYRQLTIASLVQRMTGGEVDEQAMEDAYQTAYADVVDAWTHYVANDNDGRGVILIGHSQGSGMLTRLIDEEIDDEPLLRDRLVAAYLLGTDLAVPPGEDVGGAFDEVPLCRAPDQTGCAVAYASFPASLPPAADSLFGRIDDDPATVDDESAGMVAACVNPAALAGGSATLHPYFTTEESMGTLEGLPAVDTAWIGVRDALTAECVERDGFTFLEVTVNGDPTDTRDRNLSGGLGPNWGLHLADVNLAMGDLVTLAAAQAAAYAGE